MKTGTALAALHWPVACGLRELFPRRPHAIAVIVTASAHNSTYGMRTVMCAIMLQNDHSPCPNPSLSLILNPSLIPNFSPSLNFSPKPNPNLHQVSAMSIPHITFRIPHFRILPTLNMLINSQLTIFCTGDELTVCDELTFTQRHGKIASVHFTVHI